MFLGLLLLALQASPAALAGESDRSPGDAEEAMQPLRGFRPRGGASPLTEALRLYPASPAVRNFLGVVEAGDGNYAAAERRFQEAVRLGAPLHRCLPQPGPPLPGERRPRPEGGDEGARRVPGDPGLRLRACRRPLPERGPARVPGRFLPLARRAGPPRSGRPGPAGRARRPPRRPRGQGRAGGGGCRCRKAPGPRGLRRARRAADAGHTHRARARGSGGAPARGPAPPRTRRIRRPAAARTPAGEGG